MKYSLLLLFTFFLVNTLTATAQDQQSPAQPSDNIKARLDSVFSSSHAQMTAYGLMAIGKKTATRHGLEGSQKESFHNGVILYIARKLDIWPQEKVISVQKYRELLRSKAPMAGIAYKDFLEVAERLMPEEE